MGHKKNIDIGVMCVASISWYSGTHRNSYWYLHYRLDTEIVKIISSYAIFIAFLVVEIM
jgi:hypothetical protein